MMRAACTAGAVAGVLLLLLAAAFAMQRSLIYPVARTAASPATGTVAGYGEAVLTTADGIRLRALYRRARGNLPTLLFFHGNADTVAGGVVALRPATAAGYGALIPEYRGYADQAGELTETGLYADGAAALDWLERSGIGRGQIVLVGNSLGSGIAVEAARRCPSCRALVIVSGFTSLPDVVADTFGIAALRPLVLDRYDNLAKMRGLKLPVLILHGAIDRTIAVDHGVRLAAANGKVTLQLFPAAGHELVWRSEAGEAIVAWLARPA